MNYKYSSELCSGVTSGMFMMSTCASFDYSEFYHPPTYSLFKDIWSSMGPTGMYTSEGRSEGLRTFSWRSFQFLFVHFSQVGQTIYANHFFLLS